MSSDQNFLPAASSSPLAHMSVKARANSCVFMTSNPFLRPTPIAKFPRRRPIMASDAADALAKTYARNRKLLSLRSITNGLQQTGLLVAYTRGASAAFARPRGGDMPHLSPTVAISTALRYVRASRSLEPDEIFRLFTAAGGPARP